MAQKIQIIFFLVALIFTILNIRERFFSNKVRVWEDIKTTTTTQTSPWMYIPPNLFKMAKYRPAESLSLYICPV